MSGNKLGRGWANFTHSDLSPSLKPKSGQSLILSMLIIVLSLSVMVLLFIAKNVAKALKTCFKKLRPKAKDVKPHDTGIL